MTSTTWVVERPAPRPLCRPCRADRRCMSLGTATDPYCRLHRRAANEAEARKAAAKR